MANGKERIRHRHLAPSTSQRCPFVQGDVVSAIALNFVLGVVFTGVVRITFVIQIFGVHFHNLSADPAGFGVPNDVIADLESSLHVRQSDAKP